MHKLITLLLFISTAVPSWGDNLIGGDSDPTGDHAQAVSENLEYCRLTFTRCNNQIDDFCRLDCKPAESEFNCYSICQKRFARKTIQEITSLCIRIVDDQQAATCRAPTDPGIGDPTPNPPNPDPLKPVPPNPRTGGVPNTPQKKQDPTQKADKSKPADSNCIAVSGTAQAACSQQGPAVQANNSGGVNGACSQADSSGSALATKWNSLVNNCSNQISRCYSACAGTNYESDCQDLEGNLQYMISQQNSAESIATQASLGCERMAGGSNGNANPNANPSSLNPLSNNSYASRSQSDFCLNPQNYSNPQCRQQLKDTSQGANFDNSSSRNSSASDFNVPNSPATNQGDASAGQGQMGQKANSPQPNSLAAGYGGSSGLNQAQQRNNQDGSSNSRARGNGAGPGHNTEVQTGERSGGGYQSNRTGRRVASVDAPGMQMFNSPNANGKDYRGVDLKQYLPGGKYYQGTFTYGPGSRNPQLHGPHEFIFEVLHKKYMGVCQEARLRGCPEAGDHKRW